MSEAPTIPEQIAARAEEDFAGAKATGSAEKMFEAAELCRSRVAPERYKAMLYATVLSADSAGDYATLKHIAEFNQRESGGGSLVVPTEIREEALLLAEPHLEKAVSESTDGTLHGETPEQILNGARRSITKERLDDFLREHPDRYDDVKAFLDTLN